MTAQCEVALPGPMRTAFSYAVPEPLDELAVPGARVVVPFGNRTVVGVILERHSRRSETLTLKNVSQVLDPLPALPPHLVELGRWIADYYLAPVGETFRVMLPPAVEVHVARQWRITEAGLNRWNILQSAAERSEAQEAELAVLALCGADAKSVGAQKIRKLRGGEAAAARLLRRGDLAAAEVARRRERRTQKVAAWKREEQAAPRAVPAEDSAESRVQHALTDRGRARLQRGSSDRRARRARADCRAACTHARTHDIRVQGSRDARRR